MQNLSFLGILFAYILLVGATIWSRGDPSSRLHFFTKPTASLIFVGYALLGSVSSLVWAGLLLSFLGDLLLMKSGRLYLALGLAAFLFALASYSVEFLGLQNIALPQLPLLIIPLLAAAAMIWILWGRVGSLRLPVVLYSLAMAFFVWRALSLPPLPSGAHLWLVGGACLFMVGDIFLALRKFGLSPSRRRPWDLIPYFAAQWCLVTGFSAL